MVGEWFHSTVPSPKHFSPTTLCIIQATVLIKNAKEVTLESNLNWSPRIEVFKQNKGSVLMWNFIKLSISCLTWSTKSIHTNCCNHFYRCMWCGWVFQRVGGWFNPCILSQPVCFIREQCVWWVIGLWSKELLSTISNSSSSSSSPSLSPSISFSSASEWFFLFFC